VLFVFLAAVCCTGATRCPENEEERRRGEGREKENLSIQSGFFPKVLKERES